MAYQLRERDPIFDSATQMMIERRGKELIGIGLVVIAAAIALMMGTYSPEDPGWMSARHAGRNARGAARDHSGERGMGLCRGLCDLGRALYPASGR